MKVTVVSNYINHHQIPLAEEMYKMLGEEYVFLETQPMEEERVTMGWKQDTDKLPYLRQYYQNPQLGKALIEGSDVVIFGGVDEETYIQSRLREGKPVIRVSERLYKTGRWKAISPRGLRKKYIDHTQYRNAQVYLLCAGAYVPSDFHLVRAYPQKMFNWGYFPPFEELDVDNLIKNKEKECLTILWAGRFIDWKHPEYAVDLGEWLKKSTHLPFQIQMIGGGEMEEYLHALVKERGLTKEIQFLGFRTPDEVREYMKEANIFLFSSDYQEGWGAVLNEAMNSGCACVANCAIGAAPFLIKQGKNGMLYENHKQEDCFRKVLYLMEEKELREEMGKAAYTTIAEEWNAKKAALALVQICRDILNNPERLTVPEEGPGSRAEVISPSKMYRTCNVGYKLNKKMY